eukprot:Nitzschia sp. Nitz4//scaffold84_size84139//38929//40323//NITZ4_005197-RA/size84139-processed-gene-0.98-mRNA-1//-1//CDS//3329559030//9474//frame0
MEIHNDWEAGDSVFQQGESLSLEVADWPEPRTSRTFTLHLEDMTQFDLQARKQTQTRNLQRLHQAKLRPDISHLDAHYTCCMDPLQRRSMEDLLTCDDRIWNSLTLQGMGWRNEVHYHAVPLEELLSFFRVLQSLHLRALNLHSCSWFRGHGLDSILKLLPGFGNLQELRLHGWHMDPISMEALLQGCEPKTISLLSLQACSFMGEETFSQLRSFLSSQIQLHTLDLSYCRLGDLQMSQLLRTLSTSLPGLTALHVGGNESSMDTLTAICQWMAQPACSLRDLNLRALWVHYSEDGLLTKTVQLDAFYQALQTNTSLERLSLSANCLDDRDLTPLTQALHTTNLVHLDLADNPYTEQGARCLLETIPHVPTLEFIRFENIYMRYKCASAVKAAVRINTYARLMDSLGPKPSLSLYAGALQTMGQLHTEGYDLSCDTAPALVFHFLRGTMGETSLPLLLHISSGR